MDPESVSFAETRQALLHALEQVEQQAHEREAEIVQRAEERARQILARAEARVADLDQHLARLRDELDRARSELAAIREQREAPASPDLTPVESAPLQPSAPAPQSEAAEPNSGWTGPRPLDVAPLPESGASPQETLRALRAALEALNRPREGDRPPH